MARVPLGVGAYKRNFGRETEIRLFNRFFEKNPSNAEDGVALLSRPGTSLEDSIGSGPIRAMFTLKSLLNSDLFVVSGTTFYRQTTAGVTTAVSGVVANNGKTRMAGVKGAGYERVFIADGASLQYYGGQAYESTLNLTPGTITDDVVVMDGIYYQFSVGAPAAGNGTAGTPYRVFVNASNANALANLRKAVNATGVAGTDYSAGLVRNARVEANANTALSVSVRGRVAGPPSPAVNLIVTPTGGADGLAWSSGTLIAGAQVLYGITTPDDVGIVSVAVLGSYILCVAANSQRVYFIEPASTVIDPLNFFEAESEPDELIEVVRVGDQVWLIGLGSTESWYLQGTDPNSPFRQTQGRVFSRGAIPGTVCVNGDVVFLVGNDKTVYRIAGSPEPISNTGIAERVRQALEEDRLNP